MKVIVFFGFFFVLFANAFANAFPKSCYPHHCMAVIDAGSSGSRLHLYQYDSNEKANSIAIQEIWAKRINLGLTYVEPTPQAIQAYLNTLFHDAPIKEMPVFFYATAGMRFLPKTNQEQFFLLINNWFAKHSEWQLEDLKTITGEEEGVFAWLAVNYTEGNFSNPDKLAGVMDMGGASVQIAFPVQSSVGLNEADIKNLRLYNQDYTLFVKSFLGLGQTELTHQFLDLPSCFAQQYSLPSGDFGLGDALACKKEVRTLINDVHHINQKIQIAMQGKKLHHWSVIGSVNSLVKTQPFQFDKTFTNEALLEQANTKVCNQPWDSLTQQYPNNAFLYGYCLWPSYYYALFVNGYGLSSREVIHFNNAIYSDWTLGVVLQNSRIN